MFCKSKYWQELLIFKTQSSITNKSTEDVKVILMVENYTYLIKTSLVKENPNSYSKYT